MSDLRSSRVISVLALAACSSAPGATPTPTSDAGVPSNPDSGSKKPPKGPSPDAGSSPKSHPDAASPSADSAAPSVGLSSKYPGDVGIAKDPAVVWAELFDEGTVGAF